MASQPTGRDEHVTEDEAALYDRQIRLWGLEAQTRIRKAHILVINLDGLTTEAIKNWVLAGIHRLTIVDFRSTVQLHDLSAGFFWREEDVGKDRLSTASVRIQALNPLVRIEVLPVSSLDEILDPTSALLSQLHVDAVVVGVPSGPEGRSKRWSSASLASIDDRCRTLDIIFYATGALGLHGWAFSDLGDNHEFVLERVISEDGDKIADAKEIGESSANEAATTSTFKRLEKRSQAFVPLRKALNVTWKDMPRVQLRRQKLSPGFFGILALWRLSEQKEQAPITKDDIENTISLIMKEKGVDDKVLAAGGGSSVARLAEDLANATEHSGEFSPTCAMLGGVVSQDVLNALGGREETFVNWFQLDSVSAWGPVHSLGTLPNVLVK